MANLSSSVFRGSQVVVHVCLHERSFPSDAEWQTVVDHHVALRAELAGTDRHRCLVVTDGGGPTSRQRAVIRAAAEDQPVKTALVTSSRLALGIGAVIGWVNTLLKSYAPGRFARALTYLDIPEEDWPILGEHLDTAGRGLRVDTLDAIRTQVLRVAR